MRDLIERLKALLYGRRLDRDLDEELRDHLARETEARRRAGSMAPERDALVALGGIEQTKDAVRDARGVQALHETTADLRYAMRGLRRNPGFALTVVLVLGLAIGAATAVFAVVHGVMLAALPYPEPDRLVNVQLVLRNGTIGLSAVDVLALQDGARIFDAVGAVRTTTVSVSGRGPAERVFAGRATSGFFKALGVGVHYGRLPEPADDVPGAEPVAVVTHAYADEQLGGADHAVGSAITIDGVSHAVIGVLEPGRNDLASVPAKVWPVLQVKTPTRRGPFGLRAVGRLRQGMTLTQATAELAALSRDIFPRWATGFQDSTARLTPVPLRTAILRNSSEQLRLFAGAVALVLLLAIANVATLMLVRASAREHELSIRVALGAGRSRLARLVIAECVALVVLATLVAMVVARIGMDAAALVAPDLPRLNEVRLDGAALAFLASAAALCGLLISLGPVASVLRQRTAKPQTAPTRASAGRGTHAVRGALVATEFALALPLLLGAGLLANSFLRLQHVDPGFDPRGVLGVALALPGARYQDDDATQAFWSRAELRAADVPGVTAAGLSASIPPDNQGDVNNFDLVDKPVPPGTSQPTAPWSPISNGYLKTMGIPLLSGRLFSAGDSASAPPVALVSRAWAARFYPGEDPIGHQMVSGGCSTCPLTTVIGVVGDVQYSGIGSDGVAVYVPLVQEPSRFMFLLVRTAGPIAGTMRTVRAALDGLDGQIAPEEVVMTEHLHEALGDPRRWAVVVGSFAAAGVLLAALGVFGLMSYVVRQRQREIGVRMALGATPDSVIWLVLSRGMRYALAGTAIGLVISRLESRWLGSLLYEVVPADLATVTIAVVMLTAIAALACLVPGIRAARIRPIEAISSD